MTTTWRFTPAKVVFLYVLGLCMGASIGAMVGSGSAPWGPVVSTVSLGFTAVGVAFSCRTPASPHPGGQSETLS